jgi:hypothetical protein
MVVFFLSHQITQEYYGLFYPSSFFSSILKMLTSVILDWWPSFPLYGLLVEI